MYRIYGWRVRSSSLCGQRLTLEKMRPFADFPKKFEPYTGVAVVLGLLITQLQ